MLKQDIPNIITSGKQRTFKNAGLRGLYGDPNNRRGLINYSNPNNDFKL